MQNNFDPKGFIKFINQLKIGIDLNTKSEKYGRKYEKFPTEFDIYIKQFMLKF